MNRVPLTALVVALVAASCGGGGGGAPNGPQIVTAAGGGPSSVIGLQGGTVSMSNGTSVSVPAGALASAQTFTITPSPSSPVPAGATVVGPIVILGPEGVTFSKPVTVTLTYDAALIPGGRSAADVRIYTTTPGSTDFTLLPTTPVDATHVAALTTHFSPAGAIVPPLPPAAPTGTSAPPTLPPKPLPVPRILASKAGHGDWACLKTVAAGKPAVEPTRWYTADQCVPHCLAGGSVLRANCFVKPTCPGIIEQAKTTADNNSFSALYQMAARTLDVSSRFLPLSVLPDAELSQKAAAAWILETFFNKGPKPPPPQVGGPGRDLTITVGSQVAPPDWAHLGPPVCTATPTTPCPDVSQADKKKLLVEGMGFKVQSPGAEVSTLGHEMIHDLQYQRVNYAFLGLVNDRPGIQTIVDALREVEAYSWETGQTPIDVIADTAAASDFPWANHGPPSTLVCADTYERQAAQAAASCYEWKIQHLIANHVRDGETEVLANLRNWLHQDAWGDQVWVTLHRHWETFQDEPPPMYTVRKDDGGIIPVNCSTF